MALLTVTFSFIFYFYFAVQQRQVSDVVDASFYTGSYVDFVYGVQLDSSQLEWPDLEVVILDEKFLTQKVLGALKRCSGLKILKIRGVSLSRFELGLICKAPALRVLILDECEVSSIEPLLSLSNLKALSVVKTSLKEKELIALAGNGLEWLVVDQVVQSELKSKIPPETRLLLHLSPYLHPAGTLF